MYVQKLRFLRDPKTNDPVVLIFVMNGGCKFIYRRLLLEIEKDEFFYWKDLIEEKNETASNFFVNWYNDYYLNMTEEERHNFYVDYDQVEIQLE